MEELKGKRIAVLMGGQSREREVSLRSGERVLKSLKKQGFWAVRLDSDKDLVTKLKEKGIDIVFIALHGRFGEDGCIQGLLEILGIPYTGSKVLASALAMNKVASKRMFSAIGIPTPPYWVIERDRDLEEQSGKILRDIYPPLVIKPTNEGSSIGIKIIRREEELLPAIEETVKIYGDVFVEEFILGKTVTVGILKEEALPILELAPKSDFYDYEAKYTEGMTEFIIPARLEEKIYKETQMTALSAHKALGCHGFSRVDVIVSPEGIPYVHDVNTIPGLTSLSDLPAQAKAAGIDYDTLIFRMLETAIE